MKKGRFSEEQIIGILKATRSRPQGSGSGARAWHQRGDDLYLEKQVRGLEVSEAQRLKSLEDENRRLKHLVADLSLDKEVLKALVRKNGWSLPA